MNNQPLTKQDLTRDGISKPLLIKEMFHTIQGEGPFAGCPATFVRLGGCNLRCTWCDTDYTNGVFDGTVHGIVTSTRNHLVVITGGEPFAQNIVPLVKAFLKDGHRVQVETNGTLSNPDFPWNDENVTVVVSPKTGKLNKHIETYARYFKYVVGVEDKDSADGLPTIGTQEGNKGKPAAISPTRTIYLMPRDDKDEVKNQANMMTAAHLAQKFGLMVTLQLHKIIGVR